VLDNYATHKAPPVRAWLARHPRYHLHLRPPALPGLTRWSAGSRCLPTSRSSAGVHRSVHELKAAITAFIHAHNDDPKSFVWTKSADAVLQTIARYCSDTLAVHATTYSTNL
jgi:hypothetical protein